MATPHPGTLIAPLVLEPSGISQSELSRRLGFNQPQPVNELVNGKRGFTPKMALLFEQVTQGEFPATFWLTAQALHDAEAARDGVSSGRRASVEPISLSASSQSLARLAGCERLLKVARQLGKPA
ncbi:MAG: addiction module antidote protein, HigA family [Pseudomonadota bacterium]